MQECSQISADNSSKNIVEANEVFSASYLLLVLFVNVLFWFNLSKWIPKWKVSIPANAQMSWNLDEALRRISFKMEVENTT